MRVNRRAHALSTSLVAVLAAVTLSACTGGGTPEPTAPEPAATFCDAMFTVSEHSTTANAALNELFLAMNDDAIFIPGASLETVNTAGQGVVDKGTSLADALGAAQGLAEPALTADFQAMKDFWTQYAVPLGEVSAAAGDYDTLIAGARPLIESSETTTLTTNEAAAAQRVAVAYANACSG